MRVQTNKGKFGIIFPKILAGVFLTLLCSTIFWAIPTRAANSCVYSSTKESIVCTIDNVEVLLRPQNTNSPIWTDFIGTVNNNKYVLSVSSALPNTGNLSINGVSKGSIPINNAPNSPPASTLPFSNSEYGCTPIPAPAAVAPVPPSTPGNPTPAPDDPGYKSKLAEAYNAGYKLILSAKADITDENGKKNNNQAEMSISGSNFYATATKLRVGDALLPGGAKSTTPLSTNVVRKNEGQYTIFIKPDSDVVLNVDQDVTGGGQVSDFRATGSTTFKIDTSCKLKSKTGSTTIPIKITQTTLADKAIIGVLKSVVDGINGFNASLMSSIAQALNTEIMRPALLQTWTRVRNLTLSLLTLALLVIAFANILQVDIERFGLDKMLPKIIISIVLTYFSFFIMKLLLEFTAGLQSLLIQGTLSGNTQGSISANFGALKITEQVANAIPQLIILILILVILLIAFLWLQLVLLARLAVIWLLVMIAPLAFLMQILPFTEKWFAEWWKRWWTWTMMGPAVLFMLFLTSEVLKAYATEFQSGGTGGSWIFLLMAAVLIFMAAALPLTLGKEAFGAISSAAKLAYKGSDVLSGKRVSGFFGTRAKLKGEQRAIRDSRTFAGLAGRSWIGSRLIGGMDEQQKERAKLGYVNSLAKGYIDTNKSKEKLSELLKSGNDFERQAAFLAMAQQGGLADTNNEAEMKAVHAVMFGGKNGPNQALISAAMKDHPEAFLGMDHFGLDTGPFAAKAANVDPIAAKSETIRYRLEKDRAGLSSDLNNLDLMKRVFQQAPAKTKASYGEAIRQLGLTPGNTELQGIYRSLVEQAGRFETAATTTTKKMTVLGDGIAADIQYSPGPTQGGRPESPPPGGIGADGGY